MNFLMSCFLFFNNLGVEFKNIKARDTLLLSFMCL